MLNADLWKLSEVKPEELDRLVQEAGVSKLMARLLLARGIQSPEKAESFLNARVEHVHDPFLMRDMDRAVERIIAAITAKEKICVYGDYDVDGAVSTTLLCAFFDEIGYPISFYVPHRMTEGYSLNTSAIKRLAADGVQMIITVDNGIMANEQIRFANELGLTVVVTDHHQVGAELPPAFAVVNPHRKDCSYPFKGICGAGVAFKLMVAMRQRLRSRGFFTIRPEPNLANYLDLLAIATVCDVVPLIDENRYFVSEGLKRLRVTKRSGLKALLQVSGLAEGEPISSSDLGFKLGPRINACGRIDDASLGVRLLLSRDDGDSIHMAYELNALNEERREIEKRLAEHAAERVCAEFDVEHAAGLVLADDSWHVGVVGIVASRMVEKFHRPFFLLAKTEDGMWKGSGRSIAGVSLIAALNDCAKYLYKFGGHEAAAGVTVVPDQLENFQKSFDAAVRLQIDPSSLKQRLVRVDGELQANEISWRVLHEINRLEPYGMGNPKPVFVTRDVPVLDKKIVGQDHVKLSVQLDNGRCDAIAFRKAPEFNMISDSVGLLYGLEVNRFRSEERLQLVVKEFLPNSKAR